MRVVVSSTPPASQPIIEMFQAKDITSPSSFQLIGLGDHERQLIVSNIHVTELDRPSALLICFFLHSSSDGRTGRLSSRIENGGDRPRPRPRIALNPISKTFIILDPVPNDVPEPQRRTNQPGGPQKSR